MLMTKRLGLLSSDHVAGSAQLRISALFNKSTRTLTEHAHKTLKQDESASIFLFFRATLRFLGDLKFSRKAINSKLPIVSSLRLQRVLLVSARRPVSLTGRMALPEALQTDPRWRHSQPPREKKASSRVCSDLRRTVFARRLRSAAPKDEHVQPAMPQICGEHIATTQIGKSAPWAKFVFI